jgi:hypothetical protein
MTSMGRYVTSRMGIPPRSAPRSGRPVGSAGSGPKFSLVNWAGVKKRLP